MDLTLVASIVFVLCWTWYWFGFRARSQLPLPPGPFRLPMLGSLLSLPTYEAFKTYTQWSKTYKTDIIYLNVAGASIVVLNSLSACRELLDQRSQDYSSRPPLRMLNDLVALDWDFGFQSYGEKWRVTRRLFDREFRASAVSRFRPTQAKHCDRLLKKLLETSTPDNVLNVLRHFAGASILEIGYGIPIISVDDPVWGIAEECNRVLNTAFLKPAAFFMDHLPWLKYLPSWFPGFGWKVCLPDWRKASMDMLELPYAAANSAIKEQTATPSFISYSLSQDDCDQDIIKSAAATMYSAGTDSTITTLATFILNMLAHPHIQEKAYKDLQMKLGSERLPTFEDHDMLPYITAIMRESLRYMPIGPLGIPHYTTFKTSDEYKGYRIPPSSTVLPNIWAIFRNEEFYPDADNFNPDRFIKDGELNPDVLNPESVVFGFGRRICPGRFMALSSVWITMASILAVFEIRKAVDNEGNVVEPSYKYDASLGLFAPPFTCSFIPRSDGAKGLAESVDP